MLKIICCFYDDPAGVSLEVRHGDPEPKLKPDPEPEPDPLMLSLSWQQSVFLRLYHL